MGLKKLLEGFIRDLPLEVRDVETLCSKWNRERKMKR